MLDWIRLRDGLAEARRTKGLEVAQLAEAVGVAPTTIYRIENVKDNPEHKPELDTIDAWLTATTGPKLSVFLARYERPIPNEGLHPTEEPAKNPPTPPTFPEADHGAALPEVRAADALNHLITAIHSLAADLVAATVAASARADRDRSLSGPGAQEPPRRPDLDHLG